MRPTKRHPSIRPPHPGAIIAEGLGDTSITRANLAKALGVSRNTLYKLLSGKQALTAEMALRISAVWGGSPEMWLNLQMDHDLWHAQRNLDVSKLPRLYAA